MRLRVQGLVFRVQGLAWEVSRFLKSTSRVKTGHNHKLEVLGFGFRALALTLGVWFKLTTQPQPQSSTPAVKP